MSLDEKTLLELSAYYDGELSWWARVRFERRLRTSPELREELATLERVSTWVNDIEAEASELESPDLWQEIGPALSQIDREIGAAPAAEMGATGRRVADARNWGPLAATGVVAALALAVFVGVDPSSTVSLDNQGAITEHSSLGTELSSPGGSLRYLQTNGVSYVVSQDSEDVTIIWLMDPSESAEGA